MKRTKSFSSYINSLNTDINNLKSLNDSTSLSAGAITGTSFSEDVTLFGSSIKSSDYVGGESGWRIDGTGVAEFADVYVRGDINAQTGTIGYWNISSPGVVRRIGSGTQFGTFLESENVGPTDDSKTSGVYVGLFKSYFEDPLPLINRKRISNVATITVLDSGYEAGDRVIVDVAEDSSYNNGGLPVTIIASTGDTISYINTGSDFPAAGTLDTTSTASSGTVTLYNPDIAGLYIKDYGKADIDYGYFSSAGLAFVSGSRINLIYNPSFEYFKQVAVTSITGSGTTVTYSTATTSGFTSGSSVIITGAETAGYNITGVISIANVSSFSITSSVTGPSSSAIASSRVYDASNWNYVAATTAPLTAIDFRSTTNSYQTSSVFGGYVSWSNTMSTAYTVQGTIAYSKGITYNLFSNQRVLTLRYDSFVDYAPYSAVPTSVTANTSTATINTSGAHGLSVGDLVYCDFTGVGDSVIYGPGELTFIPGTYTVTAAPTNTAFRIDNPLGDALSSPMTPVAISPRTVKVFHVIHPAVPLDQISFKFSNGSSTAIANVLNDITTASWATASNNKFLHQSIDDWIGEYLTPVVGIPPLKPESGDAIYIDSEKLRLEYAKLDSAGFAAKSNITLSLPATVYQQTANAATTLTNDLTTSSIAYMSSVVSATAISGNGTTVTVTATNNFAIGDLVTITGASTAAYNTIINLPVANASASSFTVLSSATGTTSTATATAYKTIKHVFDGISLSTESVAFYGDSSLDYSWEDPTLNSTAQISIQDPKKWVDIDLATQTGSISNLDYIGLKQSRLNIPMLSQPTIEADSDYSSDIGSYFSPSYEYENLKLSSGVTSVLGIDGSTYYNYESRSNIATSRFKAVNQLISSLTLSTGVTYNASITAEVTTSGARTLRLGDSTSVTTIMSGTTRINTNTASYSNADKVGTGIWLHSDNYFAVSRSNGIPMYIKRQLLDGVLVSLNALGTQQGSISVSGATVSYNTFLGSHYSEMSSAAPLKGTIMESVNELVEDRYTQQDRMPKVKISDSAGSRKVYGVYLGVDHDENDEERGHLIAAIGAGWIRIASGLSVEPGDLVESNGDGCGRAQADDVIRSSTVGKVTSNIAVTTYEDGSYLVPCVLYCG